MSESEQELNQETYPETYAESEQELNQEILPEIKKKFNQEANAKINSESKPEVNPEVNQEIKPEITPQQEKKASTAKKIVNNIINNTFPPVSKSTYSQCVGYKFRWVDLILPPYEVLDTLCSSKDKTYMTIYTLIRLLILGIISFVLYKYLPRDPVSETVIYLFIALVIVNFIFLGVIISKTPNNQGVIQEVQAESS